MKKNKILVGISIALIVMLVLGATYAYLASQQDKSKSADINITADTTDTLLFKSGKDLSLKATAENFKEGGNDLTSTTDATAILKANSTNNQSEMFTYNVYLLIAENTFQHTNGSLAELLVNITGPDGTVIANKDVTEAKGLINVATKKEISTTSIKEEKWEATVTLKNLSTNQAANGGASFKAKLILSSEELTLSEYVKLAYEASPNSSIYYHGSNLASSAGDLSYRYSGGSFELTDKAIEEGYEAILTSDNKGVVKGSGQDYNFTYSDNTSYKASSFLEAEIMAKNDGYLKNGIVNNYVCFGSSSSYCPTKNLYQIIGTFNENGEYRTKLIKSSFATKDMLGDDYAYVSEFPTIHEYLWIKTTRDEAYNNDGYYNSWVYSDLNTGNLNTNYINYLNAIDTKWVDMIADTNWTVNGFGGIGSINAVDSYKYEIADNKNSQKCQSKISLMYVSDYTYAIRNDYWDKYSISDISVANNNWMAGYNEWTMTRDTKFNNEVWQIFYYGDINDWFEVDWPMFTVRPVFYLKSNVLITGGSGTYNDPYRIN